MMKSYKYRLSPTREQRERLQWMLDRARELYNAALQERRDAYAIVKQHPNYYDDVWRRHATKKSTRTYYDQANQLPEIKDIREEYRDIHSQALQDVLRKADKAFKAFFRRVKSGDTPGYPRFKGKEQFDSFTYPQGGYSLTHDSRVCLSKIGSVKVTLHRLIEGEVKTCTVKREGDCWYVVFACEGARPEALPVSDEAVGIDLGLLHFATLSTGETIENPRFFRTGEKRASRSFNKLLHGRSAAPTGARKR